MQLNKQFGSWLKDRRKALDLTQAELAREVGCAVVTVKKIENSAQRPSKQMAERLAQVLAIPPSEYAAFVNFARGLAVTPPAVLLAENEVASRIQLPSPVTPFVGRNDELYQLNKLLNDPACRLITLVGLGGIGKTRLAVEAAYKQNSNFTYGVHFVSLALVNSPDMLLFAIGNVMEFSFDGQQTPIVQLTNYLRDKSLLLLLDSFEHLLEAVPLVGELLAGVPHLKLLITSRERLNLQGEWALPIEGMEYPLNTDSDHLEMYSAIQLFIESAQRAKLGFSFNSNAGDILRICKLVEGIPLAIELAAAWVRLLPCSDIVNRLEMGLDLLASPVRNGHERHHSLRTVFDQSWNLLSSEEQTALAKLSVLRSSFDLETADEVGEASLPVVASLADKSLLRADGMGHYELHELLRQYANDQLTHMEVEPGHQQRAITYLIQAAEQASGTEIHRLAAHRFGQAIAIAKEIGQQDLLSNLHHKRAQAFLKVSMWLEALPDLEAAILLTALDNLDNRVQIFLELADVSFFLHKLQDQRQFVSEALALAKEAQRTDLAAAAMVKQGFVETNDGNLKEAVSTYEAAIAGGGNAHYDLGRTLYWHGRYNDALPHLHQAVKLAQDNEVNQIFPLQDLGLVLVATGQYTAAVEAYEEARRLCIKHAIKPYLARTIANLAGFHLEVFDFTRSEALSEEARELARSADFVLAEVSAGIDLLFNFARRKEPERAEKLLIEVATAVEKAGGSHGWLWRLRLVQAQAELAVARKEWNEALRLTEISITDSRERGRIKYEVLGLKTRGQALTELGHTTEATSVLRNALMLVRPTGDPVLFAQVVAVLLSCDSDKVLAQEAYSTIQRVRTAIPDEEMRHIFEAAEPVQQITKMIE